MQNDRTKHGSVNGQGVRRPMIRWKEDFEACTGVKLSKMRTYEKVAGRNIISVRNFT